MNKNPFFVAVEAWRLLVEQLLEKKRHLLTVAQGKPKDAKFYPDIYLSDKGECWIRELDFWSVLHRVSSKPLAAYRATLKHRVTPGHTQERLDLDGCVLYLITAGGGTVNFSQRAGNHPEEDWGWDRHKGFRDPDWPHETRASLTDSILTWERGLAFANALLERREEVTDWMRRYAKNPLGPEEGEWQNFCQAFSPTPLAQLPDTGRLISALIVALEQLKKAT